MLTHICSCNDSIEVLEIIESSGPNTNVFQSQIFYLQNISSKQRTAYHFSCISQVCNTYSFYRKKILRIEGFG